MMDGIDLEAPERLRDLVNQYRRGLDPLDEIVQSFVARSGSSSDPDEAERCRRSVARLRSLASAIRRVTYDERRAASVAFDETNEHVITALDLASQRPHRVPSRSDRSMIFGYIVFTEQSLPGQNFGHDQERSHGVVYGDLKRGHHIQPGVYALISKGSSDEDAPEPVIHTHLLTAINPDEGPFLTTKMSINANMLPLVYETGIDFCGGRLFLCKGMSLDWDFHRTGTGIPILIHALQYTDDED